MERYEAGVGFLSVLRVPGRVLKQLSFARLSAAAKRTSWYGSCAVIEVVIIYRTRTTQPPPQGLGRKRDPVAGSWRLAVTKVLIRYEYHPHATVAPGSTI